MKKLKNHKPLSKDDVRELEQAIKIARVRLLINELNLDPPTPVDGKCPQGWYYDEGKCWLDVG